MFKAVGAFMYLYLSYVASDPKLIKVF